MRIRCGYRLTYQCPSPTPMLLALKLHPSREKDLLTPQELTFAPYVDARDYRDSFGNICTRIVAPAGGLTISTQFDVRDSGEPDPRPGDALQHEVDDLPDEVMVFLLGSRYCETDRLSNLAWSLFGNTPLGWPRVQAILDYVHNRLQFNYQLADATRSAFRGHDDQVGVCRDFAHLAVTFCRCMNIPARYVTGYLGDIGIDPLPPPMDFSAWFEVYLGGRWWSADARHNKPRIGRILMAVGRDATDVALSTSFGPSWLSEFVVVTDEVPDA